MFFIFRQPGTILPFSCKRSQVRYLIEKLVDDNVLVMEGKGSGARYRINTASSGEYDIKKMIIARLKEKEQRL